MQEDSELIAAWRCGDAAAGQALFARHFDGLYRFFRTKCGDDADELVQATLLACVSARAQFRGEASFRTYLFAIARQNECQYCSASHELSCRTLGIDEATLHTLVNDLPQLTPERIRTTIQFALRVARSPKSLVRADYDHVRAQGVTDEEIEAVAEELAKAGGVSWYPGRTRGALLRSVSERYRDRAKLAIAALDRVRASNGSPEHSQPPAAPHPCPTLRRSS